MDTSVAASLSVFAGAHSLDGPEALLEDDHMEMPPAAALWCFAPSLVLLDVRRHAAVEDRLAVFPALVDAVHTEG